MPDLMSAKTKGLIRELDRLGPMLDIISKQIETVLGNQHVEISEADDQDELRKIAASLYRARRKRTQFFAEDLLGEPAWDLMLDLFFHHNSGKNISITSATVASAVSPTTGLRWIAILEERGWIERFADESDKRRWFRRLTNTGHTMMVLCLREFVESF